MTANSSTSPCQIRVFEGIQKEAYILVLLSALVIFENILGMATIWRTPALHTNANRFIFSLAVSDVNVAFSFLFASCTKLPEFGSPLADNKAVEIFIFGSTISMVTLSCSHMAVIAVDRYIYIVKPFYYMKYMTEKRSLKIILCMWILCIIYEATPFMIYNQLQAYEKCILITPPIPYYVFSSALYSVDIAIVFVCYFKIARLAFRRKQAAKARRAQHKFDINDAIWCKKNRTAMMKSVKFFVIMFGVSAVFTTIPAMSIGFQQFVDLSSYYYIAMHFFVLNSGANFIIYTYMCKEFSDALKKTLRDMVTCCRRN